jgi:aldose 1-epimerase
LVEADPVFGHLVVYTPEGADYLCLEPVSHMNDALNRAAAIAEPGVVTLAPGAAVAGKVTFSVRRA